MTTCDVTLAIPTWNGGSRFRELLARCARLDPRPAAIAVIDSESTDGTADAARATGCRVTVIPHREFDHGRTRQRLAEEANTTLIAFTVQDALPAIDYLLPLVRALDDPRTAAATSRILPHESASALARRTVLDAPNAATAPRLAECEAGTLASLPAARRRELCLLDDVSSLARRDLLLRYPLPSTMMGEDVAFAASLLDAGYRLRYVPESIVAHSHDYSGPAAFRRYRDDAAFLRATFGIEVRPSLESVFRGIASQVVRDWRFLATDPAARNRLGEALRSPWLRSWQVFGQWRGSSGADRS
jgi:rhamnosyltransferase